MPCRHGTGFLASGAPTASKWAALPSTAPRHGARGNITSLLPTLTAGGSPPGGLASARAPSCEAPACAALQPRTRRGGRSGRPCRSCSPSSARRRTACTRRRSGLRSRCSANPAGRSPAPLDRLRAALGARQQAARLAPPALGQRRPVAVSPVRSRPAPQRHASPGAAPQAWTLSRVSAAAQPLPRGRGRTLHRLRPWSPHAWPGKTAPAALGRSPQATPPFCS
mmetsp:Transcript_25129/g.77520  ORF Transcript_25129/g.77520 Transcript_25129/m.77520 type:complete len:224 (-) Transcript_25129:482-1153(-)